MQDIDRRITDCANIIDIGTESYRSRHTLQKRKTKVFANGSSASAGNSGATAIGD
jgi:hypothetical protein